MLVDRRIHVSSPSQGQEKRARRVLKVELSGNSKAWSARHGCTRLNYEEIHSSRMSGYIVGKADKPSCEEPRMKFPSVLASVVAVCSVQVALAQEPPANPPAEAPPANAAEEAAPAGSESTTSAEAQPVSATAETPASEQPSEGEAADAAAPPEAEKIASMGSVDIVALQKLGYKVVNENGTQLFCKKEEVTGTRLRNRTRCLTAAEAMMMRDNAVEMLNDMSRARTNPVGD